MAPKRAGALMRPARAPRRGLWRPAAREEESSPPSKQKKLRELSIAELSRWKHVWFKGAKYYHRAVEAVAKISSVWVQEGQVILGVEASGTKDEALLRLLAAAPTGSSTSMCALQIVEARSLMRPFSMGTPLRTSNLLNVGATGDGGEAEDELADLR